MAAGDFSTSQLANIQLKAEQMWADSPESRQYTPQVEALLAIIRNQNARIQYVNDGAKDYDVKINWIDVCAAAIQACTDNCELDEPEVETKAKAYTIPCRGKTGFSVNEDDLRDSIYSREEVVAKAQMGHLKKLDEHHAQYALTKLATFATTPGNTNTAAAGLPNFATGRITIPQADYNETLAAKIIHVATLLQMNDFFTLSNGRLFNDFVNAGFNQGNADGKGVPAMFNALNITFDLFNFVRAGLTTVDAFVLQRSAVAFASKALNPPTPTEYGGSVQQTRYQVASPSIPGLSYDVYYTMECVDRREIKHIWRFESHAELFDNPASCDGFTGILPIQRATT